MKKALKRKRASTASLFLMELMAAILFFTLAASLCVTIFVEAHLQSENAKALNHAVNICSDSAELVRTSSSKQAAVRRIDSYYDNVRLTPGGGSGEFCVFFDDEYNPVPEAASTQTEYFSLVEENGLLKANIRFVNSRGQDVYELSVVHQAGPHVGKKANQGDR